MTNPRSARIAALIRRVVAPAIEGQLNDKRLSGVTVTEVRVTNDMQHARIYWTQLGRTGREDGDRKRAKQALEQSKGRLRSLVGAKAGLRLTPQLHFIYDEVPAEAHGIEDILIAAKKRDEQIAKLRENAQYASCADPYRHNEESEENGKDESQNTEYQSENPHSAEQQTAEQQSMTQTAEPANEDSQADSDSQDYKVIIEEL